MKSDIRVRYFAIVFSLLLLLVLTVIKILPYDVSHIVYTCTSFLQSVPPVVLSLTAVTLSIILFTFLMTALRIFYVKQSMIIPVHKQSVVRKIREKYNFGNTVFVFENSVPQAFCLGFFQPAVFVSTAMLSVLSQEELEAVLLHEIHHARSFDNIVSMIFTVCTYMLAFFPVVKDMKIRFQIEREVKADMYAVQRTGNIRALIGALRKVVLDTGTSRLSATSFSHERGLLYRMQKLTGQQAELPAYLKRRLLFSLSSAAVLIFVLFLPVTRQEIHHDHVDYIFMCVDK